MERQDTDNGLVEEDWTGGLPVTTESTPVATVVLASGFYVAECYVCPWTALDRSAHIIAAIDAGEHDVRRHRP